jgi:hypothetical protein
LLLAPDEQGRGDAKAWLERVAGGAAKLD